MMEVEGKESPEKHSLNILPIAWTRALEMFGSASSRDPYLVIFSIYCPSHRTTLHLHESKNCNDTPHHGAYFAETGTAQRLFESHSFGLDDKE